jgi:hypothetical protein
VRHGDDLPGTQVPAASHVAAPTDVVPVQLMSAHSVPAGKRSHAPNPSQEPVRPQVVGLSVGHSLSGSLPARTGPHSPSTPWPLREAEHALHGPSHAASQQTLSTHWLDWQSPSSVQGAPVEPSTRHAPSLMQTYPALQSPGPVQGIRQAPEAQT